MAYEGRVEAKYLAHAADLAAHTRNQLEIARTGQYCYFFHNYGQSGVAIVGNTLYAQPFFVPRAITVDRIAIEVTGADSGKSVRLGIYKDGTNLYPGALLLDASVVATDTTGIKAITISQALAKGLYWLAYVSNGAPSIARVSQDTGLLGVASTNFIIWNKGWSVAFTYAALPAPFTAGGSLLTDAMAGARLRLLSLD